VELAEADAIWGDGRLSSIGVTDELRAHAMAAIPATTAAPSANVVVRLPATPLGWLSVGASGSMPQTSIALNAAWASANLSKGFTAVHRPNQRSKPGGSAMPGEIFAARTDAGSLTRGG
jgi:hypothetical protein